MPERLKTAQSIRIEAERLRQIASHETISVLASDIRRIASEMEANAARLEQSFINATLGVAAR